MIEYLIGFTEIVEELLVIILLSSFPKEFENIIIAIETRNNLSSLDVLKVKLIEEGDPRIQNNVVNVDVVVGQRAFVARSKSKV